MKATETLGLEPTTMKFIEELTALGGPPIHKLPIPEARAVLEHLQADLKDKIDVDIEEKVIPTGPDGKLSITIVRPKNLKGKLPVVMYFHGGGWILGSKNTHDRLVREIAEGANAAVVFVNFSPSPEAHYPKPIEEAYAATQYIAENGAEFNFDPERLAVAGDSVGGNMAAVVAILAKERNGPKIDYQILLYPVTDANFETPSYKQFAEGPWLTRASMEWFWNAYAPNVAERKKHTVSPLQASIDQLKGLPPALLITDENDVLRDEGEAYAHKLMQAGVKVTAIRFLGTIHDFLLINALARTPAAKGAIELISGHLRNIFKV